MVNKIFIMEKIPIKPYHIFSFCETCQVKSYVTFKRNYDTFLGKSKSLIFFSETIL